MPQQNLCCSSLGLKAGVIQVINLEFGFRLWPGTAIELYPLYA